MKKEINPRETSRAAAFELWMSSPMPMVTLTKTFDVSRILKISRKRGWKFNMILCWAIGCAASRTREFYLLPNHAPHLLPPESSCWMDVGEAAGFMELLQAIIRFLQ